MADEQAQDTENIYLCLLVLVSRTSSYLVAKEYTATHIAYGT